MDTILSLSDLSTAEGQNTTFNIFYPPYVSCQASITSDKKEVISEQRTHNSLSLGVGGDDFVFILVHIITRYFYSVFVCITSLCPSVCSSVRLSICLSVSSPPPLSLSLLPPPPHPRLSLSLSVSSTLSLYLLVFLFISVGLSVSVCFCLSLTVSVYL